MHRFIDGIKKIVKHKAFKWLVLMQVGTLAFIAVMFFILPPKPVLWCKTYNVRVYSPEFRMDTYKTGMFKGVVASEIKIISDGNDYVYDNVKNKNPSPERSVIEQLFEERYLDITYIVQNQKNKIVELHGETKTYYTIDDHISNDYKDINISVVGAIIFELIYIFFVAIVIHYILHGPGRLKPIRRLFKKHSIEKHVYTDEENEFSPYKQKLIDEERSEDSSTN